jgi:hypothetical protein
MFSPQLPSLWKCGTSGAITVSSAPEQGTTFEVYFPTVAHKQSRSTIEKEKEREERSAIASIS